MVMAFLLLGSSILPFLKKLFDWEEMVVLPDGGIYLFYYLAGYLFVCAKNRQKSKGVCEKGGRTTVAVVVLLGLLIGMICSRVFGNYSVQMAYNYPFTVLVALLMMWIAGNDKSEKALRAVERISSLCFTVYLIHPVFLNVLYKFLHITLLDYPIVFSLPIVFLVVLMLSLIVAWLLYHIPVLRRWVL